MATFFIALAFSYCMWGIGNRFIANPPPYNSSRSIYRPTRYVLISSFECSYSSLWADSWKSHLLFHFETSIFLISLAGTPPTIVFGSTSFVTTAPAATTAPSPIVTPARTVALAPLHTFLPIWMGAYVMLWRLAGSRS